jgi:hypothetical protein
MNRTKYIKGTKVRRGGEIKTQFINAINPNQPIKNKNDGELFSVRRQAHITEYKFNAKLN